MSCCANADDEKVVIAKPRKGPSPCCPDGGSYGPLIAEPGKGNAVKWGDLDVYEAPTPEGASGKVAVLIFPDVYGWEMGLTRVVCDRLATELKCLAVTPDFFHGAPIAAQDLEVRCWKPGGVLGMVWRMRSHKWPSVKADFEACTARLKSQGVERIAVLGFCWGGWAITHAASDPFVKAAASCHPAPKGVSGVVGDDINAMYAAVQCPVLFCVAGNDPDDVKPGGLADKALNAEGRPGLKSEVFEEMKHGWVTRGTASQNESAKEDAELATKMADERERALQLVLAHFRQAGIGA